MLDTFYVAGVLCEGEGVPCEGEGGCVNPYGYVCVRICTFV